MKEDNYNIEENFDLNNLVNELRYLRDRLETAISLEKIDILDIQQVQFKLTKFITMYDKLLHN